MYLFYDAGSRMWQTDITYKGRGIFDCKSWESVKVASFSSYCHFMENDNNLFDVQEPKRWWLFPLSFIYVSFPQIGLFWNLKVSNVKFLQPSNKWMFWITGTYTYVFYITYEDELLESS